MFKIFLFVFKNKKIWFDGIKEQQYTYTHHDCGGVLDVKQTYIYVYIYNTKEKKPVRITELMETYILKKVFWQMLFEIPY
jgi:hypothetical protein